MKELDHENINVFLGLCREGTVVMAIWKLCRKGCLLDLLEEDRFQLTWYFKYSLIRDLVEVLSSFISFGPGKSTKYFCRD